MPTPRLNITPDPGNLNCRRCNKFNIPGCSQCHNCAKCCVCRECGSCGTRHPRSQCATCHNCKRSGLCVCRGKAGAIDPEQHLPPAMDHRVSRTSHPLRRVTRLLDPIRAVGIELELSNYSRSAAERINFAWTRTRRTSDGSIRGDNPMEFILGPIPGPAFPKAMSELAAWLPAVRAQANETCGFHVHVSAQEFGGLELRRLLELYRVLEPIFYNLVAPNRDATTYCRRYTQEKWREFLSCRGTHTSGEIRQTIIKGVYGPWAQYSSDPAMQLRTELTEANRRARQKYDSARYVGMNLHSWFHRGTVEFRHCEGTVDPQRITLWTQWCKWMVELASVLTDAEVSCIHSVEDYLLGCWKRPGEGLLSLPREVVEFAQRAYQAPTHTPQRATVEALDEDEMEVVELLSHQIPVPPPSLGGFRTNFGSAYSMSTGASPALPNTPRSLRTLEEAVQGASQSASRANALPR